MFGYALIHACIHKGLHSYSTIAYIACALHVQADYHIAYDARNGDEHAERFCKFKGFYHILTG